MNAKFNTTLMLSIITITQQDASDNCNEIDVNETTQDRNDTTLDEQHSHFHNLIHTYAPEKVTIFSGTTSGILFPTNRHLQL